MSNPAELDSDAPTGVQEHGGERSDLAKTVRTHFQFGWWAIVVFLSLGMALEGMHGFKVGWYLDVTNEVRRLMFTLAHAHGALLGLLNVAFAATLYHLPARRFDRLGTASGCLLLASILLPMGFFLGGLFVHGGDPGLGILLVPPGALALLIAAAITAMTARYASSSDG